MQVGGAALFGVHVGRCGLDSTAVPAQGGCLPGPAQVQEHPVHAQQGE